MKKQKENPLLKRRIGLMQAFDKKTCRDQITTKVSHDHLCPEILFEEQS